MVHGGSKTICTSTSSTPGSASTARMASARSTSPMPQPGAVIVMSISMRRFPSGRATSSQR